MLEVLVAGCNPFRRGRGCRMDGVLWLAVNFHNLWRLRGGDQLERLRHMVGLLCLIDPRRVAANQCRHLGRIAAPVDGILDGDGLAPLASRPCVLPGFIEIVWQFDSADCGANGGKDGFCPCALLFCPSLSAALTAASIGICIKGFTI